MLNNPERFPIFNRVERIFNIAMNIFPIIGVIFLKWNVFAIFYVFWLETLGKTFFQALNVLFARGAESFVSKSLSLITFILFRTGLLLFYLLFIVVFIGVMMASHHENSSEWLSYLVFSDKGFRYSIGIYFIISLCLFMIKVYLYRKNNKTESYSFKYAVLEPNLVIIHVVLVVGSVLFQFIEESVGARIGLIVFTSIFVIVKLIVEYASQSKLFPVSALQSNDENVE